MICQSITLTWDNNQTEGLGFLFVVIGPWTLSNWKLDHLLGEYGLGERQELVHSVLDTCRGGRQKLVHSEGTMYHRDRDGDNRLVSRDVCGWWLAGGKFQESYQDNHLTRRSRVVII